MARVLIHCASYPADLSSGADLRFLNLCRQLAKRHESYLVCLGPIPEGVDPKSHIGVLGFETLPDLPSQGRSILRHLRLTDAHFLKRSMPEYLAASQATINTLVAKWDIEILVCFASGAAEMVSPIKLPKLLDCCDSRTLTYRRVLNSRGRQMSLRERVETYIAYFRQRQRERALVRQFDVTTTVANADRVCLLEISGVPPERIVVVPNGVSDSALELNPSSNAPKRSVVFWGNLDFPPNWTAVHYFNKEIFLPYLADKNVEWHIIGRGADHAIKRLAEHSKIQLQGFVENLYPEIASHGVMINPMVEGSGLKNKVLEAFACGLPVVSTNMGIESVGAQAGRHYVATDDPAEFATAVLRCIEDQEFAASMTAAARQFVEENFMWDAVGGRLDDLVHEVLR